MDDDEDDDDDDRSPRYAVGAVIWLVVLALNAVVWADQPPLVYFLLLLLPSLVALMQFLRWLRGGTGAREEPGVPGSQFHP